jgi:hypothetical protein
MERKTGQDIRAGAFVIFGVAILFAALVRIPSLTGPKMTSSAVQFPFEGGVNGIKRGTLILMGGLNIGTVQSVTFKPGVDGHPPYFRAECSTLANLNIPRTATITVQQSPIGAGVNLIIQLPSSSASFSLDTDPDDDMLHVTLSQSALALLFGPHRAADITESYKTITEFSLGSPTTDLKERLQTGANDLDAVKTMFSTDWEMWRAQGKSIKDGYDTASAKSEEIFALFGSGKVLDKEKLQPAFDRIKSNLSTSEELIATLKSRWNDEILPPLADLIDRFKKDCAIIERNYESTMAMLQDANETLGNAKADMQITSVQLNRTVREITLMPWTLLGGTFEDKGEQAQFKKIALELVRSTTELNLAIGFTRELLEQDPKLAVRYPELIELLNQWITRAGANQNTASQELLNRLLGPAKP